jgi:hypothetical protein
MHGPSEGTRHKFSFVKITIDTLMVRLVLAEGDKSPGEKSGDT